MRIRCFNIEWDTDGEDVDLPNEVIVEVDDLEEAADALSDAYEWCVGEFETEILED